MHAFGTGTDATSDGLISYRIARDDDLLRTREVFLVTQDALNRSRGVSGSPPTAVSHARSMLFREHSRRHDPERFWVAESNGLVVGYAAATQRGRVWYLASLYVLPEFQGRGAGSELLDRCLATAPPGSILTTISEAAQPISNAIYMRRGLVPATPFLSFTGPTAGDSRPTDLQLQPFPAAGPESGFLDALDADVVGFVRPEEHEYWARSPGLHGYLVARGGRAIGYVYLAEDGAIGPAAVGDAADLVPTIGLAIARAREFGAAAMRVRLTGASRAAVAALVGRDARLGDGMTLFLASAPLVDWDRYLSSGSDTYF